MKIRILTALIGLPIIILIVWLNGWYLFGAVVILNIIALYEYLQEVNKENNVSYISLLVLSSFILVLMKFDFYSIPFCLISCLIALFALEIVSIEPSFNRVVLSLFYLFYFPFMFGFLVMFDTTIGGTFSIWIIFLSGFATDTFAYFGGRAIGGPKLTAISPNKTISGSICGMLASGLVVLAYGWLAQSYFNVNFSLIGYFILGVLCSLVGQIGDISASLIKRTYGSKDFGTLLPGHGGILDRFDSIIFIVPIVYMFTYYFLG